MLGYWNLDEFVFFYFDFKFIANFYPCAKQTLCRYFYWLISTNPFSRQFVAAIFHHPFQANLQAHRFYGAIRWLLCRYYARCRHHNHYRFLAGLTTVPNQSWWQESSLLPTFQILAIWLNDHIVAQMAHALIYR